MDSESDRPTDLDDDMRATADDLAADAAQIHDIESEKAELPADDPKAAALAGQTEALIEQMNDKAKVQTALIEKAQGGEA